MLTTQKKRCNSNHSGCRNYYRSLFEAKRRKDEALSLHELHRKAILLQVRRIFVRHLLNTGTATADDIRDKFEVPEGVNPNFLGSVPTPFTRARIIKRRGYIESSRPAAHARVVSLWELLDREKADQWLVDNPLPETGGE